MSDTNGITHDPMPIPPEPLYLVTIMVQAQQQVIHQGKPVVINVPATMTQVMTRLAVYNHFERMIRASVDLRALPQMRAWQSAHNEWSRTAEVGHAMSYQGCPVCNMVRVAMDPETSNPCVVLARYGPPPAEPEQSRIVQSHP